VQLIAREKQLPFGAAREARKSQQPQLNDATFVLMPLRAISLADRKTNLFKQIRFAQEVRMFRLIAIGFAVALATSAQAMPLDSLQKFDGMTTQVREACGAGMHRVNGVCVRTPTTRAVTRCAAGMRLVEGRCIR
jgi:hypothetical protein